MSRIGRKSSAPKRRKPPAPPRSRGRPTVFDAALSEKICLRLADGETLRKICRDKSMPAKSTVLRWAAKYGVFATSIARARELQAESLIEEGLELVDTATVQTAHLVRLKFDARRWFASKVAPKKYGDRLMQEVSGPDGGPIETTEVPPPLPPKEVAHAVAELVGNVEAELGLSPGRASLETRMKNILATGHMPPDLYAAMFQSRKAKAANVVKGKIHG